ncbi:rCG36419 [Rattus norvegicus]|uniref:RCG36419 n=1 Tax=Rattus norvegicus TaxID=10116 RepID=A6IQ81_RAT|nr:rCG36419 [Rattus norvegicus]
MKSKPKTLCMPRTNILSTKLHSQPGAGFHLREVHTPKPTLNWRGV